MNASWMIPFIVLGGALQTCGAAMNSQLYKHMLNPWLASRMVLQVHDELLFEVAAGEREQLEALVRDKMGGAYPLDVPLEVSVGYGHSWDTAAH